MSTFGLRPGQLLYFYIDRLKRCESAEIISVQPNGKMMLHWRNKQFSRNVSSVGRSFFQTEDDALHYHSLPPVDEEFIDDYEPLTSLHICPQCKECVHLHNSSECLGDKQPCEKYSFLDLNDWSKDACERLSNKEKPSRTVPDIKPFYG